MLNYDIGLALGLPLHEFEDMMKEPEVSEFRRGILEICQAWNSVDKSPL